VGLHVQGDAAAFGELDRIGQQVVEDLLQAQAVHLQLCRCIGAGGDLQLQALLCSQRFEGLAQAHQDRLDGDGLFGQFHMAGFDLGQVQDVVDQRQQVGVGRMDRLGILDLFGAEVALAVVRQQPGQDQRAVERGAQLVGHVGQEFGLVARGGGQLAAAAHQVGLRAQQQLALGFQLVGAFFQVHVDLFQLGLLLFQVGLGLLQAAALLLQFLVGHPQLFLLGLQFLALALGLFQQFDQFQTQLRGAQGHADGFHAALQQCQRALAIIACSEPAQFQHADHAPVGGDRGDEALGRRAAPQHRFDRQVRPFRVAQMARADLLHHFAQLAAVQWQLAHGRFGQGDAAGQQQALALHLVQGTDLRIQMLAQHTQCQLGQPRRLQVALQADRHRVLAFLQPQHVLGVLAGADGLHHDQRGGDKAESAEAAVDDGKRGMAAGRRQVVAHHQQHARDQGQDQRHLRTALEHTQRHRQEVAQPHRVAQWREQLGAQGDKGHSAGRGQDPGVTREQTSAHA